MCSLSGAEGFDAEPVLSDTAELSPVGEAEARLKELSLLVRLGLMPSDTTDHKENSKELSQLMKLGLMLSILLCQKKCLEGAESW